MANLKLNNIFGKVLIEDKNISGKQISQAEEIAIWFEKECLKKWPDINEAGLIRRARAALQKAGYIEGEIQNCTGIKRGVKEYFDGLQKKGKVSVSRKLSADLLHGLINLSLLPQWTSSDIESVIDTYHNKFAALSNKTDDKFAAYDRLMAAYETIALQYPVPERKPELFISISGQFYELKRKHDKNFQKLYKKLNKIAKEYSGSKRSENHDIYEKSKKIEAKGFLAEEISNALYDVISDFDAWTSPDKLIGFANEVKRLAILTKQERKLFDLLIEVASDPANVDKKKNEICETWKSVYNSYGFTDANFRQLKRRLIEALTKKLPGNLWEMLYSIKNREDLYHLEKMEVEFSDIKIAKSSKAYVLSEREMALKFIILLQDYDNKNHKAT